MSAAHSKEVPWQANPDTAPSALHPQTRAAWARAAWRRQVRKAARAIAVSYFTRGMDPDTFVRTYGVEALYLLGVHDPAPDPIGDAFDAWAAAHPEEAAHRLAWPARCDAAALPRLRERCASGESLQDLAVLDELAERREAARRRAELARVEAERKRLVGEGGADVERRASAWLATVDGNVGDLFRAALGVIKGFALGEASGRAMLEAEFLPRYHRKVPESEWNGVVRRAVNARLEAGYMLAQNRT